MTIKEKYKTNYLSEILGHFFSIKNCDMAKCSDFVFIKLINKSLKDCINIDKKNEKISYLIEWIENCDSEKFDKAVTIFKLQE